MLTKDWGDGWISRNGRDLAKIAVNVAGFDGRQLTLRLLAVKTKGEWLNVRTVERVIEALALTQKESER